MNTNMSREAFAPRVQHRNESVASSSSFIALPALGPSLQRPDSAVSSPVCSSCEDDETGTYVCADCKARELIVDRCSQCGCSIEAYECVDAAEARSVRERIACGRGCAAAVYA